MVPMRRLPEWITRPCMPCAPPHPGVAASRSCASGPPPAGQLRAVGGQRDSPHAPPHAAARRDRCPSSAPMALPLTPKAAAMAPCVAVAPPASTNSDVAAAVRASAEAPRLLLEHRYAASVDPDHVEEFVPEALRLGALAGFGGPLLGERARSRNSLRLSGIRCLPAPKDTTPMWRTPLMTISRRGTNGTSYEPERLDTRMQGS